MNPYDDEYDPGEAAREQARTPGNAHRRRVLNAILAAWDAYPGAPLARLLAQAAAHCRGLDASRLDDVSDADFLAGLRALVKG